MMRSDLMTSAGRETARLAQDLEKTQRNPETRQLAGRMRELSDRYAQGNERVKSLEEQKRAATMILP